MSKKLTVKNLFLLVLSCVICSIGVNWVAIPNVFAVTGLTGLAMTISEFTGFHYAVISYGLTFIVLIITVIVMGKKEVSNILFLSILYPAVLWLMSYFPCQIVFKEKLIAVAFFGALFGIGTGITYRIGFSYGGTDTIGKLLKCGILKAVQLKTILLIMLSVFSLDVVAYAFVGQLIYANCMNFRLYATMPEILRSLLLRPSGKALPYTR